MRANGKRVIWIGAAVVAAAVLITFKAFNFDVLAIAQSLRQWIPAHPIAGPAAFFAAYVVFAGLSLPGATVLTLLAGSLFGFAEALPIVVLASAGGALLSMLAARHLLLDFVKSRFSQRLAAIDGNFERDGAVYLISLRLVPVIPFFLVNLAVGLTRMPAVTFVWASLAGMFPLTAIYVAAGSQLATLESPRAILSPRIIAMLLGLALLPFVVKKIVALVKDARATRQWPAPRKYDYNLIVIGAGAGGLVAAYVAAAAGARVALFEDREMGGECLNTGCVPSKALIRSAKLAHEARHAADFGLAGRLDVDFAAVMRRVGAKIAEVAPHDSEERYRSLGVDVVRGTARIVDPYRVDVAGRQFSARRIVVATGSEPAMPAIPGLAGVEPLTSDSVWSLTERPRRLLVLGGGAVGCELAQAFARLGCDTVMVESSPRLVVREDPEASEAARVALAADGVRIVVGASAHHFEKTGDGAVLHLDGGGEPIAFDKVIVATGRRPRLSGLGLEELGLIEDGELLVDARLRTRLPTIYAAGDVVGKLQFTHAASHYAWSAAMNALFGAFWSWRADWAVVPMVIYTDPEIARVGLTEMEATEQKIPFETTRYDLADLDRAIVDGAAQGFVKVLTAPGKDRIIGVTIAGARAGDILGEFTLAMSNGLGLGKILKTIHPYPGWMEAAKASAGVWRQAHLPRRLLKLSTKYLEWLRR